MADILILTHCLSIRTNKTNNHFFNSLNSNSDETPEPKSRISLQRSSF